MKKYIEIDGIQIEKPRRNRLGLAVLEYVIWFFVPIIIAMLVLAVGISETGFDPVTDDYTDLELPPAHYSSIGLSVVLCWFILGPLCAYFGILTRPLLMRKKTLLKIHMKKQKATEQGTTSIPSTRSFPKFKTYELILMPFYVWFVGFITLAGIALVVGFLTGGTNGVATGLVVTIVFALTALLSLLPFAGLVIQGVVQASILLTYPTVTQVPETSIVVVTHPLLLWVLFIGSMIIGFLMNFCYDTVIIDKWKERRGQ